MWGYSFELAMYALRAYGLVRTVYFKDVVT